MSSQRISLILPAYMLVLTIVFVDLSIYVNAGVFKMFLMRNSDIN